MDTDYSAIRDLPQAAQLSDEDWNLFVERSRSKRFPKGVTIIQAGQLVKHAYFCTMGLFRLYYTGVLPRLYPETVFIDQKGIQASKRSNRLVIFIEKNRSVEGRL